MFGKKVGINFIIADKEDNPISSILRIDKKFDFVSSEHKGLANLIDMENQPHQEPIDILFDKKNKKVQFPYVSDNEYFSLIIFIDKNKHL